MPIGAVRTWAPLAGVLLVWSAACEDGETTAPAADGPPEVVALEPADGAVAVPPGISVSVRFSERVVAPDPQAALRLACEGKPIAAAVTLDSTRTLLELIPAAPLGAGWDCRCVVAAGIRDDAGHARADSLVTRFTTGLAFRALGRLFAANARSRDVSAVDLDTWEPVAGSPVRLAGTPRRLRANPARALLYVVLSDALGRGGVVALDARTLEPVADTGWILAGASDLDVAPASGRLFVLSPDDERLLVLDAVTLEEAHAAIVVGFPGARPERVVVSERLRLVLVGLAAGGRLAAYRLPSLAPVRGFPVQAADDLTGIALDEVRARAWVTGDQRYAVVDLLNPARTERFQSAPAPCNWCIPAHWRILYAPHLDRFLVLNRRQAIVSLDPSTGMPAPESPADLGLGNAYFGDFAFHPRTGEILVLGVRSLATPLWAFDPRSFARTSEHLSLLGDDATDIEVVP